MKVAYVNPFVKATVDLFKTMMNIDITIGTPQLKSAPQPTHDISGIIGLSGKAQGSIAISFPKITALKIVSKLIGSELKVIGPELTDGIGEIVNIVAGYAKKDLTEFNLSISLPNVIIGKDHVLAGQTGVPTIVVPITCVLGDFAMEVALKTD
jgi:chemotaxis protein CheX